MIEQVAGALVLDAAKGVAQKGLAGGLAKIHNERGLLSLLVWRPNGKARISVSALLRIQRTDGRFAIIRNLHRPEDFSAIGGVFKCRPVSGLRQLDRFEFVPENRLAGEDVTNDVRGYTKRKYVSKILAWSANEQSAVETGPECLRREIREELTEEFDILEKGFPIENLTFSYSHQCLKISHCVQELMPLTQAQLFRVYDLGDNRLSIDLFDQIAARGGENILWVTRNDILEGRCGEQNKPIGAPVELFIRNTIHRQTSAPPNRRPG